MEEEHAQGVKKLSRAGIEIAARPENRQGTYSQSYKEINRIYERAAEHGLQFAVSVQQMADDLHELATNMERSRKHWKQIGLNAEKKVADAESLAEKAKAKYESLAEQYERVKTGDKQGGKFGLKGHKSAAQLEEELHRKVQQADSDYASKVQSAQAARQELISTHRPQTVRNLQQLITECDSGLTLQVQKFGGLPSREVSFTLFSMLTLRIATFNEKLLVGQALSISPLKAGQTGGPRTLQDIVQQIDNQKDFNDYILAKEKDPGAVSRQQVQYDRHPVSLLPLPLRWNLFPAVLMHANRAWHPHQRLLLHPVLKINGNLYYSRSRPSLNSHHLPLRRLLNHHSYLALVQYSRHQIRHKSSHRLLSQSCR